MIGAILLGLDGPLWDAGGPGIVGFELAGSQERARDILVEWGGDGHDAARLSLWLDFLYLAVYGAFWALAAAAVRDLARRQHWRRFAAVGAVAVWVPVGAAACDAAEDVNLLLVLGGNGGSVAPPLATGFAGVKFVLITLAIAYVLVGLGREAFRRFPRGARITAAAVLVGVSLALAVNTWAVERETEPAKADVGRILRLPGGDIQVREDGHRGDPPLLLLHGYGCSLHWWDRVVPALARRHHVIRLDLLGHGGSAKPRNGYSMEHQADLVAAALRRLGIRRTAVVGHSMGGIVATALVERHRTLVSRLMTIGTPPNGDHEHPSLVLRLAFWPVTGEAVSRVVPRDMVRAEVERTSPPRFDIPGRLVADIADRTTYRSRRETAKALSDYWDERSLDRRLAGERLPLTVVYGPAVDGESENARDWRTVPGVRFVPMAGLGHSPQVERPARAARVILGWATGRSRH